MMRLCTVLFSLILLLFSFSDLFTAEITSPPKKEMVILNPKNIQSVIRSSPLLVIDVYVDWCRPCQELGPIFSELHHQYGNKYQFAKFNADKEDSLANHFQITHYPTIIFIKNGKEVGRRMGPISKEKLLSAIQQNFE